MGYDRLKKANVADPNANGAKEEKEQIKKELKKYTKEEILEFIVNELWPFINGWEWHLKRFKNRLYWKKQDKKITETNEAFNEHTEALGKLCEYKDELFTKYGKKPLKMGDLSKEEQTKLLTLMKAEVEAREKYLKCLG